MNVDLRDIARRVANVYQGVLQICSIYVEDCVVRYLDCTVHMSTLQSAWIT